jgi:hypothetical protein
MFVLNSCYTILPFPNCSHVEALRKRYVNDTIAIRSYKSTYKSQNISSLPVLTEMGNIPHVICLRLYRVERYRIKHKTLCYRQYQICVVHGTGNGPKRHF